MMMTHGVENGAVRPQRVLILYEKTGAGHEVVASLLQQILGEHGELEVVAYG